MPILINSKKEANKIEERKIEGYNRKDVKIFCKEKEQFDDKLSNLDHKIDIFTLIRSMKREKKLMTFIDNTQ